MALSTDKEYQVIGLDEQLCFYTEKISVLNESLSSMTTVSAIFIPQPSHSGPIWIYSHCLFAYIYGGSKPLALMCGHHKHRYGLRGNDLFTQANTGQFLDYPALLDAKIIKGYDWIHTAQYISKTVGLYQGLMPEMVW
jgi:hypothetical protein